MLKDVDPTKFPLRMEGDAVCTTKKLFPLVVRVSERISTIPTIEVDFFCADGKLALEDIVGKPIHIVADSDKGDKKRWFKGTCISAKHIGKLDVGGHFKAIIRPWLWYLTRRTNLRIYQKLKVSEIIEKVIEDHGFKGDIKLKLSETYEVREYCVQYRETDFDFISRLMEEEGIYYYFDHDADGTEKMVFADGPNGHEDVADPSEIPFLPYGARSTVESVGPVVFEWNGVEKVRSGEVSLDDYNFENSTGDLGSKSNDGKLKYSRSDDVLYDYPGRFRTTSRGDKYAKVRMQADAIQQHVVTGRSDAINLAVGRKFTVSKLKRTKDPKKAMLIECLHDIVQLAATEKGFFSGDLSSLATAGVTDGVHEPHIVRFQAIDSSKTYRAPLVTPWPRVGGIHTAVVTGKDGEEIYTDPYGRIKVKFHWDTEDKSGDNTTCWIRTMMPWTGKNWGAIAVPRVGQEVVIDFEEGDPDRPLCVGMLYNDKTMPPYKLPDNKTQSGVKTNSSKGGGGFNELMFEDKKGSELVRFQAERDYKQFVLNDAEIEVGLGKKDKGDLTLTVHNDVTETINEGNYTETVKKGDHSTTLDKGDHNTVLKMGDMSVDVKMGKITVKAMKSIEFKVGGSSIKMDPTSITVKSTFITVKGNAKVDITSPLTTVKADGMLTINGALVKIN
jgi:type VI secretion system secreted protein VgrG